MFSHSGANGPESMSTHMFRRVRQTAAPGTKSAYPIASCFGVIITSLAVQITGGSLIDREATYAGSVTL